MQQITTLTMNPAIDKSAHVENVTSDVKLRARDVQRHPGGGGINVSRAIRRLGGTSSAAYVCGGVEGQVLQDLLAAEEIQQAPLAVEQSVRENLTVTEDATGEQYRFGMPGPQLSDSEVAGIVEQSSQLLASSELFVASGSLPPGVPADFYARLARIAREHGTAMIVDTSGDALAQTIEEGVFLIKPNLHELATLLGEEELEGPAIREAAGELVSAGKVEHVLVSMGSGGALLVNNDVVKQAAAPTVRVRSRIGAGDSMIGGLTFSLARGEPVETAMRWGVAAGAAAVMTPGTELCRGDDARRLFEQTG